MHLDVTDRSDGISQIALVGKLDINGLHEVDLKFHALTASMKQPAIVDLTGLDYIASLGMGMLISCAKSLQLAGQPFVLFGAHGTVDTALRTAGIDQAIPMAADVAEAEAIVSAA